MAGLTIKQENFCLVYIETGNASEAYRRAYDAKKSKPETINRTAKELIDNPNIAARIKELREPLIKKAQLTVDDLVKELEEARIAALTAETVQASAATAATMGKAKLLGLVTDKQQHEGSFSLTVNTGVPSPNEN
jgi:phage terminase small subunit